NRPNIFVANEVFYLPKLASHGALVQNTLGGWEANSIVNLAEGSSLTVFQTGASGGCTLFNADGTCNAAGTSTLSTLFGSGYGNNQRPLVTDIPCNIGRKGDQFINGAHFTDVGFALGTVPGNMEHRGTCRGAPYTDVDGQLAKNWYIKEKYRIKFSMDFFNLFNHPNFNSANLEGVNYNPGALYCGGATPTSGAPCSPSNNIVTSQTNTPSGFTANAIQGTARQLQYALRFSF
ncbi:MAG TPA: hypothetical protein VH308_05995, partial [Terracidiphilus sp.]|nr:hypothetical protein [Terracidiphilus sp.]